MRRVGACIMRLSVSSERKRVAMQRACRTPSRKVANVLLSAVLSCGLLPAGAWAADNAASESWSEGTAQRDVMEPLEISASGTCGAQGDNLIWTFDSESGILTISGEGAMQDYSHGDDLTLM